MFWANSAANFTQTFEPLRRWQWLQQQQRRLRENPPHSSKLLPERSTRFLKLKLAPSRRGPLLSFFWAPSRSRRHFFAVRHHPDRENVVGLEIAKIIRL